MEELRKLWEEHVWVDGGDQGFVFWPCEIQGADQFQMEVERLSRCCN